MIVYLHFALWGVGVACLLIGIPGWALAFRSCSACGQQGKHLHWCYRIKRPSEGLLEQESEQV